MTKRSLLPLAVSLLAACASAMAGTIPFYETGTSGPGTNDPHWTVTTGSGTSAAKVLSLANVWFAWAPDNNGSTSNWIAPVDSIFQPAAPYTYSQTFDLTGFDPNTASISGLWYVDDTGTMSLNGTDLDTQSNAVLDPGLFDNPPAKQRVPFTITTGFVAGLNTLSVRLTEVDTVADGFRLTLFSATADAGSGSGSATPEPGSVGLAASGILAVAAGLRRRSK